MGIVSKPYTFVAGQKAIAAEVNENFDILYNVVNGYINGDNIYKPSITTDHIVNLAITTAKIDDEAVTSKKIANNAVTSEKIAIDAVISEKIAGGALKKDHFDNSGDLITTVENLVNGGNADELHIHPSIYHIGYKEFTTETDWYLMPTAGYSHLLIYFGALMQARSYGLTCYLDYREEAGTWIEGLISLRSYGHASGYLTDIDSNQTFFKVIPVDSTKRYEFKYRVVQDTAGYGTVVDVRMHLMGLKV